MYGDTFGLLLLFMCSQIWIPHTFSIVDDLGYQSVKEQKRKSTKLIFLIQESRCYILEFLLHDFVDVTPIIVTLNTMWSQVKCSSARMFIWISTWEFWEFGTGDN